MTKFQIKRVYDDPNEADGYRVLVDRLWPRGMKKEDATLDEWNKDVAPSSELRTWFGHKPERFREFVSRYEKELTANPAVDEFRRRTKDKKIITLLYGAKDTESNQAVVLQKFLASR